MGIFSKKDPVKRQGCGRMLTAIKISAPILKALYYIFIVLVLLIGIIALIMPLVNTSVEDMMLPPFMSVHGEEYYSITVGGGIRIEAPYDTVELGDIKTVIYAELMMLASVLCILAPISLFLSKLFKNISHEKEYEPKNARYITYIGLTVMVGSTFVRVFRSFYNYLLVRTFVSEPDGIRFAFELDLGGIAVGTLIIVLACIYGHAVAARCELPTAAAEE